MAVIGKLTALLGLDSRPLDEDTKKAKDKLKKLASSIKGTMQKVGKSMLVVKAAIAAVGAATGAFLAGIASNIDRITKASEQLGLTAAEFAKLEHAAKLSGVKVEDLTMAIRLMSKGMLDMASGGSTPAIKALEAMNIQVKDLDGNLKSNQAVMLEVADKFRLMEDGAGKTAIAMNLFGESGAKLIPLLNQGSEGIKAMGDEAERLGLTFGTKTSKEAVRFQDNITRLKAAFTGFLNLLGERLFPIFNMVMEEFLQTGKESKNLQLVLDGLVFSFKALLSAGVIIASVFSALGTVVRSTAKAIGEVVDGEFSRAYDTMKSGAVEVKDTVTENAQIIRDIWDKTAKDTASITEEMVKKQAAPLLAVTTQFQEQQKAQAESQALLNAALAEGKRIYDETRTPMEQIIDKQKRLSELFKLGAIDADVYGRAMKQATAISANNFDALAGQVSTALGVIFKDSKTAAIASALINTYQGITKAIATYPPPIAQAMAAIQSAMGFAQVAAIRNTSESSASGGSAAAAGQASAATAAAPSAGVGQSLTVQGIDPSQIYSGGQVRNIAEALIDYQEQGGKVIIE